MSARCYPGCCSLFFFQAEDGIRDLTVTGVQTCALPICALPGPLAVGAQTPTVSLVTTATGAASLTNQGCVDRKSTRLNSSHSQISYAVFCLKKKKGVIGNS